VTLTTITFWFYLLPNYNESGLISVSPCLDQRKKNDNEQNVHNKRAQGSVRVFEKNTLEEATEVCGARESAMKQTAIVAKK
jgi:phosphoribosyl-ATP pyrophosphohydrolase